MANLFTSVPIKRPSRTAFGYSPSVLTTTEFGRLIPIQFLDAVPGDTWHLNVAGLARFSPMISPPFGRVDMSMVWFAVPYRLVNAKFQKMITGYYQNTAGSTQFLKRQNMMFQFSSNRSEYFNDLFTTNSNGLNRRNLLDYIGLQLQSTDDGVGVAPYDMEFEALRVLAFWYTYFEYFVDQNLGYQPLGRNGSAISLYLRLEDGTTQTTDTILNWEQFTQICLCKSQSVYANIARGGYITIGDLIESGSSFNLAYLGQGIPTTSGSNMIQSLVDTLFLVPHKCWAKDYFTSALPWAQKGNPVTVPITNPSPSLSGDIQVSFGGTSSGTSIPQGAVLEANANSTRPGLQWQSKDSNGAVNGTIISGANLKGTLGQSAKVDLSNVGFTINDLRTSFALQTWLEKNARCGSRYVEQILSHFGVRTSDARLQRPEYLGGFKIPVHISSTAQTSEDGTTPQGNLAGQGLAAGAGSNITFFAEEHTLLICMAYIQPKPLYMNGVNRLIQRTEFYDFYFPEFAHLGEQAIKNSELCAVPAKINKNDETFGYQSRYSEYKFINSHVHGDFKHDSLKSWLFGLREFDSSNDSIPKLNGEFVTVDPTREPSLLTPFPIVASDSFDRIYCQFDFNIKALRPMPKYGIPYL